MSDSSETTHKCTNYVDGDWVEEGLSPCHCPVCGGFLAWEEDMDEDCNDIIVPVCNKCKTELIALPYVEDGEVIEGMGKICPISERKK